MPQDEELDEPNFNISEEVLDKRSVSFNKNQEQKEFNKIKGTIVELEEGEKHCWVILSTGRERKRHIYVSIKKDCYKSIISRFAIDDKVCVKFYVASFQGINPPTNGVPKKWYTVCSLIEMEMLP